MKKPEIIRMRNGYYDDVLTSDDIQGFIYRENFRVYDFRKVIDKLFELRKKYKDEKNDVMQLLVELIMNSLYGEQIRKDIEESDQCK